MNEAELAALAAEAAGELEARGLNPLDYEILLTPTHYDTIKDATRSRSPIAEQHGAALLVNAGRWVVRIEKSYRLSPATIVVMPRRA